MAYRDFADPFASALFAESMPDKGGDPHFGPAELRAIALAQIDAASGVRQPGRLSRFLARWFGLRVATGLADRRLETLRRFALTALKTKGRPPLADIEQFLAAGFSTLQARALLLRALPLSAR